jgi:hypothetical protein
MTPMGPVGDATQRAEAMPERVRRSLTVGRADPGALTPMRHARRLANRLPNGAERPVAPIGRLLRPIIADELSYDLAGMRRRAS